MKGSTESSRVQKNPGGKNSKAKSKILIKLRFEIQNPKFFSQLDSKSKI